MGDFGSFGLLVNFVYGSHLPFLSVVNNFFNSLLCLSSLHFVQSPIFSSMQF